MIENAERVELYLAGMDRQTFERDGRRRLRVTALGPLARRVT